MTCTSPVSAKCRITLWWNPNLHNLCFLLVVTLIPLNDGTLLYLLFSHWFSCSINTGRAAVVNSHYCYPHSYFERLLTSNKEYLITASQHESNDASFYPLLSLSSEHFCDFSTCFVVNRGSERGLKACYLNGCRSVYSKHLLFDIFQPHTWDRWTWTFPPHDSSYYSMMLCCDHP